MTDTVLITLMRHAKSDWGDDTLSDFDRPLNDRGCHDVPIMARRFGTPPTRIVSSPAQRAITTAVGMARGMGLPARAVLTDHSLYLAEPDVIWRALCAVAVSVTTDEHILVVGHNPGMSELAQQLVAADLPDLPTCSWMRSAIPAAALADDAPPASHGRLIAFTTPKGKLDLHP